MILPLVSYGSRLFMLYVYPLVYYFYTGKNISFIADNML